VIGGGWQVESDAPQTLEHYIELYDYEYADETGSRTVHLLADMSEGDSGLVSLAENNCLVWLHPSSVGGAPGLLMCGWHR